MHVQLQFILLLLYMNLNIPVLFIPQFLNLNTDSVLYVVRNQKFLGKWTKAKPGHKNFVNNRINLYFISIHVQSQPDCNIRIFLEFSAITKPNF